MSPENKPQTDHEKLADALGTIKEVLIARDLQTVRGSVNQLESRLNNDLDAMRRANSDAVAKLTDDVTARIDSVLEKMAEKEKARDNTRSELEERLRKAITAAEQQLDETGKKAEQRASQLKNELQGTLSKTEEALRRELGGLGQAISALQLELQQQMEQSSRTSALLSNMASVLTGGGGAPQPGSADAGPAPMSEENVDNALDQMFGGDSGGETPAQ